MTGIVDWAAARARMVVAFIILSVAAGVLAYVSLPKEGEPDIDIPALFVSVPFPGISAADSETLLVKVMEQELSGLDGLKTISGTAAENYGGVALQFEFGWDKTQIIADVRDRMNTAEAKFPAGADKYSVNEINFSEFPILVIALSGDVPERTLLRAAKDLQSRIAALEPVLKAELAGHRDEMLEVLIDPLKLEAYNITAAELITVVTRNNQLIAAGEVETASGAFSVKIPSSFNSAAQVYGLPVKVNGDRTITLGDLAQINLTFKDPTGTARFNGESTVAIQVVKRKGFNLIDTSRLVQDVVAAEVAAWPEPLRRSVSVTASLDQSTNVEGMVRQLEGSVLTAIALVMVVVLATLGTRSALLVGFSVPTSFLLTFAFFAVMGISVSNIVMFGLILAVGMLVDSGIVVVEYADTRIQEGSGPMAAYTEAAKRMFWPIVSSTATTLCAFLPMLFWPGVAGEFMGMLPVTLIFVLSASLLVALIYVPVVGGVAGRVTRQLESIAAMLRPRPLWLRLFLVVLSLAVLFAGVVLLLSPRVASLLPGALLVMLGGFAASITLEAAKPVRRAPVVSGYRRSPFGRVIRFLTGNPVMPLVSIAAVVGFVVLIFGIYAQNGKGVEFFVATEPEQAIVYVQARGNLSLTEKDAILQQAEALVVGTPGVKSTFSFAGAGGLNSNTGGAQSPLDSVGQIQLELAPWSARKDDPALGGDSIIAGLTDRLQALPGIRIEVLAEASGPASGKPLHLRLSGDDFDALGTAVETIRAQMATMEGIIGIEDTRPLPGIDWEITVDVARAGRFGADVATVGGMVQLVTRGVMLDTMRVDSSDEEIEIRVRLPEGDRVLSTLDSLKVRTADGLVPLSNFISRKPVAKLGRIDRVNESRVYDVKADVAPGLTRADGVPINATERISTLNAWLATNPLPQGVNWAWTGDQEDQAEAGAFLAKAFAGALGLMFIILLAQFNSVYNAVLVLLAVVLSTTGVLIGMLVMGQTFSIIMTGTGIVALAGIVVNNNIILIDTYQDFSRYMPKLEAITRTAEQRLRPVLLTTITTMAGLAPMMFGLSVDFLGGGYTLNSPSALWWKQLATAVVFGLGIATVLTLVLTPSLLALRVWFWAGAYRGWARLSALAHGAGSVEARDLALTRAARAVKGPLILWEDSAEPQAPYPIRNAAE
ncbi:MAG: efflux RND transporter permease subunit [Pseudotabrizicola sp.]|uniref:efflux RND transporter permease subunit n=1 Tax=Pseudotabrizicola sp. TaxID=2939647 RepID=UPI0027319497|nr:efflux RND transporter permease subunit [Pseudotabrizicola sp.]MDP2083163.1 efflux RND transporter permease subunit [Pseudotabrizicola sp.]MDZ7572581.1 efflux RND transporter permease subunit [Pseudotabrizicola sp.]